MFGVKILITSLIIICFIPTKSVSLEANNLEALLDGLHEYESKFTHWMKEHDITFDKVEEFFHRFHIFCQNDKYIQQHNDVSKSYTLGHNEFSHLTWEEFRSKYFGLKISSEYIKEKQALSNKTTGMFRGESMINVPESVDWVEKGAVTEVKNQGQCGACWAFSTTGAIEGAAFVSSNILTDLSEQELVDCDHNGDMGCGGGLMDHAFKWIEKNGGICGENEYTAYHAEAGVCTPCQNIVNVDAFHDVESENEDALKVAVSRQPVSVAIQADQPAFQFYKKGVFDSNCGSKIDHGVLVVGYGIEDGNKFWKIKNSWGKTWGEDGFIKIARDLGPPAGQCGVALVPSYPHAKVISQDEINLKQNIENVISDNHSSASIKQCDNKDSSLVEFSTIMVYPLQPSRGKPIQFSGNGTIKKAFETAKFKLVVKLGGFEVYQHDGNICGKIHIPLPVGLGHINVNGFNCPVKEGYFDNVGMELNLPVIAPEGNYQIELTSDAEEEHVFCVNAKLTLNTTPEVYDEVVALQ